MSSSIALVMSKNWAGKQDKYVGLRIKLNNQWRYGWVRLSIPSDTSKIIVKDYAYNQSPDTPINAGQTVSRINELYSKEKNTVFIYPNPFKVSATMQFQEATDDAEINISDMYGRGLKTLNNISGNNVKVDRGNLSYGIYFYELKQDGKNIYSGKLIIID